MNSKEEILQTHCEEYGTFLHLPTDGIIGVIDGSTEPVFEAMETYANQVTEDIKTKFTITLEVLRTMLSRAGLIVGVETTEALLKELEKTTPSPTSKDKEIEELKAEVSRLRDALESKWISVKDKLPEIVEDGESKPVLCIGHKGTHPNEEGFTEYEVMKRIELSELQQVLTDYRGKKIKHGWSNRWWDTNPDLYEISHWQPLPAPPTNNLK